MPNETKLSILRRSSRRKGIPPETSGTVERSKKKVRTRTVKSKDEDLERKVIITEPKAGTSTEQKDDTLDSTGTEGGEKPERTRRKTSSTVGSTFSTASSATIVKRTESELQVLEEVAKVQDMLTELEKARLAKEKEAAEAFRNLVNAQKELTETAPEHVALQEGARIQAAKAEEAHKKITAELENYQQTYQLEKDKYKRDIDIIKKKGQLEQARIEADAESSDVSDEEESDRSESGWEDADESVYDNQTYRKKHVRALVAARGVEKKQRKLRQQQTELDEIIQEERILAEKKFRVAAELRRQQQTVHNPFDDNNMPSGSTVSMMMARQTHGKELPHFTGNAEEWLTFINAYERSNRMCRFSSDENYHRLQKCLKGDAARAVQSMMTTPDNVTSIIEKLRRRFGQPEMIIETLVDKVKGAPAPREDKPELLVEFADSVDGLVRTLTSFKCWDHLSNPILMKQLEGKLPYSYRMSWMEWMDTDKTRKRNLEYFAKWLDQKANYASRICMAKTSTATESKDKGQSGHQRQRNRRHGEENVMFAADDSASRVEVQLRDQKCNCCDGSGHRLSECRKFKLLSVADRLKLVKTKRLCFRCLGYGHRFTDCRSKKTCRVKGCERNHHELIHEDKKQPSEGNDQLQQTKDVEHVAHANRSDKTQCGQIIYQVLEVTLVGPKGEVDAYAILDNASGYTMIEDEEVNRLGLKRKKSRFAFKGLGNDVLVPDSSIVELKIISKQNKQEFYLGEVRTYSKLDLPCRSISHEDLAKWKHLAETGLRPFKNAKPTILIGLPHADLIVPIRRIDGPPKAPIAALTKLGWVICGQFPPTLECKQDESVLLVDDADDRLHQLVKEHFTTENFGVNVTARKPRSKDDLEAIEIMDRTAIRRDKQWEIGLLWRNPEHTEKWLLEVTLPESRYDAEKRLRSIEKKMDKDPAYAKVYCDKMQEYVEKGYIRKLSPDEVSNEGPRTWYLPHFGVTNVNKPGKFRLVFDAAAKSHGTSLNDQLFTGPDLVPPLPAILFRFRQRAVGYTADIADMFHRIRIREEDQDAQRFLWRGLDRDRPPDVMRMNVMIFGAASSPSCAQFIKNKNAEEVGIGCPGAVKDIIKNHYVDDFPGSSDTVPEAVERFQDVYEIHKEGNFQICKWISNKDEFNKRIPEELRAGGIKNMDLNSGPFTERVLGMHWDPVQDNLTFTTSFHKVDKAIVEGARVPTKREALALIMSVYDPLGLVSSFSIKAKIILQETWRSGIGWEDVLPVQMKEKWISWITELNGISNFKVPRCYSPNFTKSESIELHTFVDASESAFAAVCYFRIEYENMIDVALVASKAKVAPLKPLSIPRMELQAAVMGCRLAEFIRREHEVKIHRSVYWSDSRTVICWLRSDGRKFQQFVSHRIGEIQEHSDVTEWRWIPTADNVADDATRDSKPTDWTEKSRWINGPKFLHQPEKEWPVEKVKNSEVDCSLLELKKELVAVVCKDTMRTSPMEIERFSSWIKLLRVTAMVVKFVEALKGSKKCSRFIVTSELENAKDLWVKWSQAESYPEEIMAIQQNTILKSSNGLGKLSPWLDANGILRMRGRIPEKAEVFGLDRNPIILHPKHYFTSLMITHYHEKAGHNGMERVVNDVRQRYCIPKLRAAVKRVWSNCQVCKNRRAEPAPPLMGDLPLARLNSYIPAFTVTGMDYFGPMDVAVGRRREKRYGCLFTCMSTRAVHIEIAASLSTDACIMAIRRFISRRGCPTDIFSDNGTNFKGANNEIRQLLAELNQETIRDDLSTRFITWHFITPAAPHMGGSWERLVRSVKVALAAILKEKVPKEEVLQTLMAEAENSVNGRPLTHVSCDPEDPEALTPNHFLIGRPSNISAWRRPDNEEKCLRKQWHQAQQLADMFWKRWISEYLPTLSRREKWFQPQKPIEVGDIVILVDSLQPRNVWPKGRIVAVYPGKDGQVRTVDVQTAGGTYRRPVVKVCVLDVKPRDTEEEGKVSRQERILLLRKVCLNACKTSSDLQ